MPPRERKSAAKKTSALLPTEGVDEALTVIETPEEVIPPVVDDTGATIPAELQFTTGSDETDAEPEIADEDILELSVDGHVLYAIKPTVEQWGAMMAMMSRAATMADRIHAMQKFASTVLDEPSYQYVESRLMDRNDKFGHEVYDKMLRGIIDKFSPDMNRAQRRAQARLLHR
ncbi:hypothetical protein IU459_11750 [Nocardia amamiensis]|uniref:Tail assembly chaperone n=1 Tax=Nocardia amamiensis TaxID=404578 RepID=A0ABS0CTP5_9NOCA|nr:hypothetical protein [Nocardia amamiensis]MBF6298214.1 hypothetical protein [Nocardia amamiensis]